MHQKIWVFIGVGVTVAAGAAVLLPGGSPPPDDREIPSDSTPHASTPRRSIEPADVPQNAFAPINHRNVPDMASRRGPLRAPEPTKTAEARRPVVQQPTGDAGSKKTAASPAAVTPAPAPVAAATTTTTGAQRQPPRPAPSAAASQAQLEMRRQEIEIARRNRLAQNQRIPVPMPGNMTRRSGSSDTQSPALSEAGPTNPSGAPSLADILRDNPWLADYAPGGRLADSTNTNTNSGTRSTTRPGNLNNSGTAGSNTGTDNSPGGSNNNNNNNNGGTITTSGGGGVQPTATAASFKWIPVDNRACGTTLAGFRTNDLYIRIDVAAPVLGLSSETNPLTIAGGSFFQSPNGNDDLPTSTALQVNSCVQFDTYLNGGTGFSLLGGGTNNPVFTATRANGSLFNFAGVVGTQDSARFGDTGFYLLFGRFTAPTAITDFSGRITVNTGIPGTPSFRNFTVDVTFDSTVWTFNAAFGLPGTTTGGTPPGETPPGGTPPGETPPGGTPPGGTPPGGNTPPGNETPNQGDPCANQAPGITAVWRPIDNMTCTDEENEISLAGFRTADLYLRMATTNSQSTIPPFSLQFASAEVTGSPPVTLANGSFFQYPTSLGNVRPDVANIRIHPCLVYDTYYAIDTLTTENPSGAGSMAPPQVIVPPGVPAFGATAIRGLWVVPGFGATSALPAAKDSVRFPNDPCGYYVRIARFSISQGASLSGTLFIAFVLPGTATTTTAEVVVPNCPACWGQPAP